MTSSEKSLPPMTVHVVPSDGSPFDHALEGESFVVGRSSKADLTIPDRSMSRMHARLYQDQGKWLVEDLGSRNGTLLGGRAVDHPAQLGHGSVIQVGSTSLTLREATRPVSSVVRTPTSHDSHTIFKSATELLQEPAEIRTKWTEFQSHASFSEEHTQIDSSVLETRMGELQCKRYTVTDGPTTDVYWFAIDKPGMPVKVETTSPGGVAYRMTMINDNL